MCVHITLPCASQGEYSAVVRMRKWRASSLGVKRAKKRAPCQIDPAPKETGNDSDDDDSDGESLFQPPIHDPSPPPEHGSPSDSLTGLEAGFKRLGGVFVTELRERHVLMKAAQHKYEKVKRRWDRKVSWVVEGKAWDGPHSLWRHASDVKRDELRLATIDAELALARRLYVYRRGRWRRFRTYARLTNASVRDDGAEADPALTVFSQARA